MSSPGKPHQPETDAASLSRRRIRRLSLVAACVGLGVLAYSIYSSNSDSATPAMAKTTPPKAAVAVAAKAPAAPVVKAPDPVFW